MLNRPKPIKEIEFIILNTLSPGVFLGFVNDLRKIITILAHTLSETREEGNTSQLSLLCQFTLIQKLSEGITRNKNCKSMFLMNMDSKVLNKNWEIKSNSG